MSIEKKKALEFLMELRDEYPYFEDFSTKLIAEKLGMSEKNVRRKMNKVNKHGLSRLKAIIDFRKLGLFTYLIRINTKRPEEIPETTKALSRVSNIFAIYVLTRGKTTHLVKARVKPENLNELIDEIKDILGDKIDPPIVEEVRKVHVESRKPLENPERPKTIKIDGRDWDILKMIRESKEKLTLKEIGDKLGITEPSVHARLKKIKENDIITAYYLAVNWNKVPEDYFRVRVHFLVKMDPEKIPEFVDYMEKYPNKKVQLRSTYETYGRFNLFFGLVAPNLPSLQKFLSNFIKEFKPDTLRTYILLDSVWRSMPIKFDDVLHR